jgi:hypothetical protein
MDAQEIKNKVMTDNGSVKCHSNMCSSVHNGRQVNDLFVQQFSWLYQVNIE